MKELFLIFIMLIFNANTLLAEDATFPIKDEFEDFADISMENLLNINVDVYASTKSEKDIDKVPSIATVITSREISQRGFRTLTDIFRNMLGVGINNNGHWPDTGIRGINDRTTYGDKILILIDGHNMSWRQFNRNYHNSSWLSVDDISRIEVVRGPGSALWGTGAFNGVVNIVTKNAQDVDGVKVTYGTGLNYKSNFIGTQAGKKINDDFSLLTFFSLYEDDVSDNLAPFKEFVDIGGEKYGDFHIPNNAENSYNFYLKTDYKNLKLNLHKSRFDPAAVLSTFSIGGERSRFVTDRSFITLNYNKSVLDAFGTNLSFSYDDYKYAHGAQYEDNPYSKDSRFVREMEASDQRYELNLKLDYKFAELLTTTVGADFEYLDLVRWHYPEVWEANDLKTPLFTNWHAAAFLQMDSTPTKWLNFTAATRYDKDEVYGSVFNPRAGIVFTAPRNFIPADLYVKFLYGSAFKAPSFHDLYYFRKNAYYGNPELEPETVKTYELLFGYKISKRLKAELVLFQSELKDLIGYQKADGPLVSESDFPQSQLPSEVLATSATSYSQKTNKDNVRVNGVEMEIRVTPTEDLFITANGTYREPVTQKDDKWIRVDYSAEYAFSSSINYLLLKKINLNLNTLLVGDKSVPARKFAEPGFDIQWKAEDDPTLRTDPAVKVDFTVGISDLLLDKLDLTFKVDNIFDVDPYDAGREILYPGMKRNFLTWLTYSMDF